MMLLQLPPELVREVVGCLQGSKPSLVLPILLTCRSLRTHAEPVLYRIIDTGTSWSMETFVSLRCPNDSYHTLPEDEKEDQLRAWETYRSQKYASLVQTLAEMPRIAAHVRCLQVDHMLTDEEIEVATLAIAFSNLVKLKSLTVSSRHIATLFSNLETLVFELMELKWDARETPDAMRGLHTLQFLLKCRSMSSVPNDALPNLRHVTAPSSILKVLLPGRRVTSLLISPHYHDQFLSQSEWKALSPALRMLRQLAITPSFNGDISHLTIHLANVRRLHLHLPITDIHSVLLVRNLVHLKLSSFAARLFDGAQNRLMDDLFSELQYLRAVDVAGRTGQFLRYLRGQVAAPIVVYGDIDSEWRL